MSGRYGSRQELAHKIEWEGGLAGALDYGITVDDMPEGDTELADLWGDMQVYYREFMERAGYVGNLLDGFSEL